MNLISITQNQTLATIGIAGMIWVFYVVFFGEGAREKKENDVSFGLFDSIRKKFFD